MRKAIPTLRRTIQALSFIFLLYLIVKTAFPLELNIPVDLYLRLDPFIGIITILTKKEVILRMLPAFGVFLFVFIFGNFFCGWFCPMGATIDFSTEFSLEKRNGPRILMINLSQGFAMVFLFFLLLQASWFFR
jgi:polyferredoxin